MWLKFLLGACFICSLLGAFVLAPLQNLSSHSDADLRVSRNENDRRLRLLSWNIGNADLESETRAHAEDLPAVAKVIIDNDPDAVALQELTGEDQLKLLLTQLKNQYRGYVCSRGSSDRVEAVLVKDHIGSNGTDGRRQHNDHGLRFTNVPAGDRFAAAATFRLRQDLPGIVFVSAHADAFSASRRRAFVADVVDWARSRTESQLAFVAGDFNLEVSVRNKTNLFTDDAKHDSESYAYLLKYFRDLGSDAGETSINDRRIDYIFGARENISLRRAEVLREAAVGRMDHWPLLVEVGL
jgi:endonuclease/exonuclease/phosphatase family metal-dependent hydrolase